MSNGAGVRGINLLWWGVKLLACYWLYVDLLNGSLTHPPTEHPPRRLVPSMQLWWGLWFGSLSAFIRVMHCVVGTAYVSLLLPPYSLVCSLAQSGVVCLIGLSAFKGGCLLVIGENIEFCCCSWTHDTLLVKRTISGGKRTYDALCGCERVPDFCYAWRYVQFCVSRCVVS